MSAAQAADAVLVVLLHWWFTTATNSSDTSVHREKIMCLEKYDGARKSKLMVAFVARAKCEVRKIVFYFIGLIDFID